MTNREVILGMLGKKKGVDDRFWWTVQYNINKRHNKTIDKCADSLEKRVVGVEELKFCSDNCKYLNPTERQQDALGVKYRHLCRVFACKLYHHDAHPKIYRAEQCMDIITALTTKYLVLERGDVK